ncbi:hypothetical protein BLL37_16045 [Pseudomonas azotoformans]|uniref:Uncharacterized protein n=1 Tax=Pseudomonas azotoformans TaxID=47878 RepID=A0A1V2JHK7_PSEAZ|nr:hypothetical protein [Pseudomonas azotoformans]OIN46376.1 hypothetical protein BFL39_22000 [Pseudomonas azotoformans]ONH44832.1 hypothetical protein BLL37_16045 [Pseudomonas azotoformans]SDN13086.1 hypothetical protein SAMN04489799_1163 [Pseudomonas azotoformans]
MPNVPDIVLPKINPFGSMVGAVTNGGVPSIFIATSVYRDEQGGNIRFFGRMEGSDPLAPAIIQVEIKDRDTPSGTYTLADKVLRVIYVPHGSTAGRLAVSAEVLFIRSGPIEWIRGRVEAETPQGDVIDVVYSIFGMG